MWLSSPPALFESKIEKNQKFVSVVDGESESLWEGMLKLHSDCANKTWTFSNRCSAGVSNKPSSAILTLPAEDSFPFS